MKSDLEISIFETVGSALCVSSGDGQKIYDRLATAFREKRRVVLSFDQVSMLTSAFLNSAVGQLYGTFNENEIRSLLHVTGMQSDDLELLKRVVDTAKLYFKDPKKFERSIRQESEEDDDEL